MDMRDKVITGFMCLLSCTTPNDCSECGYECNTAIHVKTPVNMIFDAIGLLKAQEPVEPTLRGGIGGYWYCGACNYQISRGDKFCRYCGQEVKWG